MRQAHRKLLTVIALATILPLIFAYRMFSTVDFIKKQIITPVPPEFRLLHCQRNLSDSVIYAEFLCSTDTVSKIVSDHRLFSEKFTPPAGLSTPHLFKPDESCRYYKNPESTLELWVCRDNRAYMRIVNP